MAEPIGSQPTELYRRFRPTTLDRVIGNEETVATLKNMLARKTLPHAILLSGPSGCGKTTLARIIAKEVGCNEMDFAELNASDNRGIDTVREVMRNMNLAATGACRVWLLDEVHQMSKDGQQASLKMLEDTPQHVYFILATTDPEKLLKTIQNRCLHLPVRLLTYEELGLLIDRVSRRANITLSEPIKMSLIEAAQGSARACLVLLEKIAALDPSQQQAALEQKQAEMSEAIELCRALMNKKGWPTIANILQNLKSDPEETRYAVLGYARACLLKSPDLRAVQIIEVFKDNFYDSKAAGLAYACYVVANQK